MRLAAAALLSASLASGPHAAVHPDFSGYWVWNSAHTQAVTGVTPPQPQGVVEWTITQTPNDITMVRPWPIGPAQTYRFKLSDGESVNTIDQTVYHTTSRWDGENLIVEGTMVTIGETVTISGTLRQTMWLTASGDLVVETVRRIQPPPNVKLGRNGGAPFVQVFVKTPPK